MIESLTKAVAEAYNEDATVPSVVVSWLDKSNSWYVAIHRFDGPFARGRKVIFKAQGKTLDEAVTVVGRQFLASIKSDSAIDTLAKKVR